MKPARATGHRWLRSIGMDAEVIGRDYTRAISGAENLHSGMKLSKTDQPVTACLALLPGWDPGGCHVENPKRRGYVPPGAQPTARV